MTDRALGRLEAVLLGCAPAAVAVSGGVDSMTLAALAGRRLGSRVAVIHAVSPAVPPSATRRVRRHAEAEGWDLRLVDAGEFQDETYLANPADRCFFCKHNLYRTLSKLGPATLLSGTNTDDLGDWRPGLAAAAEHGVRHPYVEAGIDKAGVRRIARTLGLDDLAELPAAPCLSSRVETGLRIRPDVLQRIDRAERLLRATLAANTVRCRVRREGVVLEVEAAALRAVGPAERDRLGDRIARIFDVTAVRFEPYRRGSAFLRPADG